MLFSVLTFTSVIIFISITQNRSGLIIKQPDTVINNLESQKEGIYVFGFEDCPWCKELYPHLETTLKDSKQTAFLVDTHKKNFTDDNRSKLLSFIQTQTTFESIVVPIIFTISKDNYFQYHIGTVDGHEAQSKKMSHQQEKDLTKKLEQMIDKYKEHNK